MFRGRRPRHAEPDMPEEYEREASSLVITIGIKPDVDRNWAMEVIMTCVGTLHLNDLQLVPAKNGTLARLSFPTITNDEERLFRRVVARMVGLQPALFYAIDEDDPES